jgi:hypothetical protein
MSAYRGEPDYGADVEAALDQHGANALATTPYLQG